MSHFKSILLALIVGTTFLAFLACIGLLWASYPLFCIGFVLGLLPVFVLGGMYREFY